jgi:Amt family ammonium transporter
VAINQADTVWLLVSSALVMLMTPGVAFFYGGMVRRKNLLSTMMMSFACLGLVGLLWVFYGYSLAFGTNQGGFIGGLNYLGLMNVGQDPSPLYAPTVPHLAFMVFQAMFAIITVALITGAVVERVKFSALLVFSALWLTLVYAPVAHWIWGGGWLAKLGVLDFAGGAVVHINAGVSALAFVILLGKRRGFPQDAMEPNSIPLVVLGAGLLWFGWFGFNAGSALTANGLAANAFVVTNIAAAAGALSWMGASWIQGKPASLGMISGAIAGLVAITPAAGFVGPMSAIAVGVVAGLLCYGALLFRVKKGLDESLDAWAIHGMGGLWGALATGIFAVAAIGGVDGLIYGNPGQFAIQAVDALAVMTYAFVVTAVLAFIVDRTIGLRVSEEEEYVGLDIALHGESISE